MLEGTFLDFKCVLFLSIFLRSVISLAHVPDNRAWKHPCGDTIQGEKQISTGEDCLAKENQMSDTDLFNKQETGLLQLSSHMLGGGSQVKYWFICLAAIIYKGCEVVTSWTFLVQ
ncbi:hypothetical protein KY284_003263 [Solanum tuberosum]|nr:hypothetical protein KY284_003263 [Solanum tuberosum]